MTSLRGHWRRVRKQLLANRPLGLVSVDFLRPGISVAHRRHRKLLMQSHPGARRPVALGIAAWQWVRWMVVGARRSTAAAVERHGAATFEAHAMPVAEQRRRLLRLALAHGIPPLDVYRFDLLRDDSPHSPWHFVYDCEVGAFHWSRNDATSAPAARLLLADKAGFAQAMIDAAVPVAHTVASLPKGSTYRDLPLSDEDLFVKPRFGSQARGVLRVRRDPTSLHVWRLLGSEVQAGEARSVVDRLLGESDYIAQRYYPTHPDLVDLGVSDGSAVTVRIISERDDCGRGDEVSIYCAFAEVPVRHDDTVGHVAVEVDAASGLLGDVAPIGRRHLTQAVDEVAETARGRKVPDWPVALTTVEAAHRQVDGIFAIAWDFVISPQGPVLLEGNSGWGVTIPQIFRGPIFADRAGAASR